MVLLEKIIQNLDFSDQSQFEDYLKNYNITIDDIRKKIEIENEWKNLIGVEHGDNPYKYPEQ